MAKTGIPYYTVKNGNGFWEPNGRMRALGFHSVPCGADGPDARDRAGAWNQRWHTARRELSNQVAPKSADGPEPAERVGYVYFLRLRKRIKIGFSRNPFWRVNNLATGLPEDPVAIAAVRGSMADEKYLHRQLSNFRLRGEWFTPSSAVIGMMSRVVSRGRVEHEKAADLEERKAAGLSA